MKNNSKVATPQLIQDLPCQIINICSGIDHCFAISNELEVYAWGANMSRQLGIKEEDLILISEGKGDTAKDKVSCPTKLRTLVGKKIDRIATGTNHSFAWSTESGEVYCWGSGDYGKLGFSEQEAIPEPKLFESFVAANEIGWDISDISCGESHTLAVIHQKDKEEKKLFVWGCSGDWQLGIELGGKNEAVSLPIQMNPDYWNGLVSEVKASSNYSMAIDVEVMDARSFAIILTNLDVQFQVFAWGCGEFNKLGFETDVTHQKYPRQIESLSKLQIVKISLGPFHGAAISSFGGLYTWGRDANGQLGHGSDKTERHPRQVQELSELRILDVCCGEGHTLALSEGNEVYSWGGNKFGQLGMNDCPKRSIPKKITYFEQEKIQIVQIQAGKRHSLALSNDGRVFSWGNNEFNQLALSQQQPIQNNSNLQQNNTLLSKKYSNMSEDHLNTNPNSSLDVSPCQQSHPGFSNSKLLPTNLNSQMYSLQLHSHAPSNSIASRIPTNEKIPLQENGSSQLGVQTQFSDSITPLKINIRNAAQQLSIDSGNSLGNSKNNYNNFNNYTNNINSIKNNISEDLQQPSQERDRQILALQQENQILRSRIKYLEQSYELDQAVECQEKIYSLTNQLFNIFAENTIMQPSNQVQEANGVLSQPPLAQIELEILSKNQQIDTNLEDFNRLVDQTRYSSRISANFCEQLMFKLSRIIKKVNYSQLDTVSPNLPISSQGFFIGNSSQQPAQNFRLQPNLNFTEQKIPNSQSFSQIIQAQALPPQQQQQQQQKSHSLLQSQLFLQTQLQNEGSNSIKNMFLSQMSQQQ